MNGLHALILAAAVLLPAAASAQTTPEAGARVRILQQGRAITGTLDTLTADSLAIVDGRGQRHIVASRAIDSLQVSIARERHFLRYFAITTGVAALAGGLISAATWEECHPDGFLSCLFVPESRMEAGLLGAAVGGVIGLPIGAVVGIVVRRDVWNTITPGEEPGSMIALTHGAPGRFTASFAIPLGRPSPAPGPNARRPHAQMND